MKVAGTSSLQELFVSTHRDAESVDHLVPMMLCCGDDVTVLSVELLDLFLKDRLQKTEKPTTDVWRESVHVKQVQTLLHSSASTWSDASDSSPHATYQTERPDPVHGKMEAHPQRFHHHQDITQRLSEEEEEKSDHVLS